MTKTPEQLQAELGRSLRQLGFATRVLQVVMVAWALAVAWTYWPF